MLKLLFFRRKRSLLGMAASSDHSNGARVAWNRNTIICMSIAALLVTMSTSVSADAKKKYKSSSKSKSSSISAKQFSQCDFIHKKIDVDAQYALYYHMKKGPKETIESLTLLGAIRDGQIAGILQQDREVPAKMAIKHGDAWWTMIPDKFPLDDGSNQKPNAILYPVNPAAEKVPVLAYKKSIASNRAALTKAIIDAWNHSIHEIPVVLPKPSGKKCGRKPVTISIPDVIITGDLPKECDMAWDDFFPQTWANCDTEINTSRWSCVAALGLNNSIFGRPPGRIEVGLEVLNKIKDFVKKSPALAYCEALLATDPDVLVEACVYKKSQPYIIERTAYCNAHGTIGDMIISNGINTWVLDVYRTWLKTVDIEGARKGVTTGSKFEKKEKKRRRRPLRSTTTSKKTSKKKRPSRKLNSSK